MSDSDDAKPAPRKSQPKPRPRRLGKIRSDSGGSPTSVTSPSSTSTLSPGAGAAAAGSGAGSNLNLNANTHLTSSPPQARRRIEDDFFSKAKNYRDVFKVQETTFLTESKPEGAEVPALDPIPLTDDIPIFDFEDEAKVKSAIEVKDVEDEPKRKREISLTPPPELPTRQYIPTASIPITTSLPGSGVRSSGGVFILDEDNEETLAEEAEPELDPELASIAAKLTSAASNSTSTPNSSGYHASAFSSSRPLSQSQSQSQSLSQHSQPNDATPIIPGDSSFSSTSGTSGDGMSLSSPASSTSSQPSASLPLYDRGAGAGAAPAPPVPPPVVNILFRMIRHPLLVVPPEQEPLMRAYEQGIKVTVKADASFRKAMEFFCLQKHIAQMSSMVFTFRGTRLMPSSTPQSLDFPPLAVVDVYEQSAYRYTKELEEQKLEELDGKRQEELALQRQEEQQAAQASGQGGAGAGTGGEGEGEREDDGEGESEFLFIKLRGKDTADEKIRVKKTTTVQAILSHYKSIKKMASHTPAKLEFDDEALDPGATIGSTEVEDDDMLVVRVG